MKKAKNILGSVGIKPTYERLRILKYLEEKHTHPGANTIYEEIIKEIPTISKTTVYNALKLFVEKNIVIPIYITGKEERFDVDTKPHHHFLCTKCGKIIDIDLECPYCKKGIIEGHQVKELHGYFIGICKDCLEKKKGNE